LLEIIGEVAGFEFAAGADQHIAQPARLDFLDQCFLRYPERATRRALLDQEPVTREITQPFPEVGVDGGWGGSHLLSPVF
jgi:hypothetical protein